MIIKNLLPVIPALPATPAAEPESETYVTGQFPVSIDSCLRRNDELRNDVIQVVLF